jgi:hypothetical protein
VFDDEAVQRRLNTAAVTRGGGLSRARKRRGTDPGYSEPRDGGKRFHEMNF